MGISLDTSRWPLTVVVPGSKVSNEELAAFLTDYTALVRAKREPYVIAIDLRLSSDMPAAQRKIITDHMQKQEEFARLYCKGTVLVFSSAIMRALLTGILWMRKPSQPLHVTATLDEAADWAHAQIKRTTMGMSIPA